ncbi:mucin-19-like isoform X2 [Rhinatrema bivittatum]|uniref:mucin-19-like isoform X2 n=1 Tax=Rhinatrema bivittatum TaxID=194408 RepID=UPI00112E3064|nr:mucin-19-like isoform X2 [Rhinatrema bivittatum]
MSLTTLLLLMLLWGHDINGTAGDEKSGEDSSAGSEYESDETSGKDSSAGSEYESDETSGKARSRYSNQDKSPRSIDSSERNNTIKWPPGSSTISGPSTTGSSTISGPSTTGSSTISGPSTTGSSTISGPSTTGSSTISGPSTTGSSTISGPSTTGTPKDTSPADSGFSCATWSLGGYQNGNCNPVYCNTEASVDFFRSCDGNIKVETERKNGFLKADINIEGNVIKIDENNCKVNNQEINRTYQNTMMHIYKKGEYITVEHSSSSCKLMYGQNATIIEGCEDIEICGYCGNSNGNSDNPTKGVQDYAIENKNGTEITNCGADEPCKEGIEYCSQKIHMCFESCVPTNCLDGYINVCAIDYCNNGTKGSEATFTELARKCTKRGCPKDMRSWRNVCDIAEPSCPANQVFDDCTHINEPTCSNPAPVNTNELISRCRCPEGFILDDISGNSTCISKENCPCTYKENKYSSGEQRNTSDEGNCTCNGGRWNCSKENGPGKCKVSQGLEVTTFGGLKIPLCGSNTYVLMHDMRTALTFHIETHQANNSEGRTDVVKCTLTSEGNTFTLSRDGSVTLNNTVVSDGYFKSDELQISRCTSKHICASMKNGLYCVITYQRAMQVTIHVPGKGFENSKGLCGSNDGNTANDLSSPEKMFMDSYKAFACSWAVSAEPKACDSSCIDVNKEMFAKNHCAALQKPPFTACHEVVVLLRVPGDV